MRNSASVKFHENKTLTKISEFTVFVPVHYRFWYHIAKQPRLRQAWAFKLSCKNIGCLQTQILGVDEDSDQKLDLLLC